MTDSRNMPLETLWLLTPIAVPHQRVKSHQLNRWIYDKIFHQVGQPMKTNQSS